MKPVADKQKGKNSEKTEKKPQKASGKMPDTRKRQNDYGKVVRKYREKMNVSQRQASRDLGYSGSVFCNIERGVCNPQLDSVIPICEYLQIPLDEFFGKKTSGGSLSSNEEELVRRYREAPRTVREAILTILRNCHKKQTEAEQYPSGGIREGLMCAGAAPVVKRGRGRPRKERDPAEEQKPKRGRGRPRKNPLPETAK